jgi:hypothetical protein
MPETNGENKKLKNRTYLSQKDKARLAKKLKKHAQVLVKAKGLESQGSEQEAKGSTAFSNGERGTYRRP